MRVFRRAVTNVLTEPEADTSGKRDDNPVHRMETINKEKLLTMWRFCSRKAHVDSLKSSAVDANCRKKELVN